MRRLLLASLLLASPVYAGVKADNAAGGGGGVGNAVLSADQSWSGANTYTGVTTYSGSVNMSFVSTTSAGGYTLGASNYFLAVDATAASRTVNLPTATGISGRVYVVKKIDSSTNTVTLAPNGSDTIDNSTNTIHKLLNWNESMVLIATGTGWYRW